jgi:hypothetical protein
MAVTGPGVQIFVDRREKNDCPRRTFTNQELPMAIQTFETVRQLSLDMPGVVDGTAYGAPALKLGGKVVTCVPTNKSAEANSLVVHIDLEHRAELLRQQPDVYYVRGCRALRPRDL